MTEFEPTNADDNVQVVVHTPVPQNIVENNQYYNYNNNYNNYNNYNNNYNHDDLHEEYEDYEEMILQLQIQALDYDGEDEELDNTFQVVQPPTEQRCLRCQNKIDEENPYTESPTTTFECMFCMETFENTCGNGCKHCIDVGQKPCCCKDCCTRIIEKHQADVTRFQDYVNRVTNT